MKYTPEKRVLDETLDENLVLENADGDLAGVEWEPGQDAVEAFAALSREMVRSGEGAAVHALSASAFFNHLVEALREAIRTRERHGETWIVGNSLYELIADDWVITDQGVEVNGRGVVIRPEQLQGWHDTAGEAPEGLDADLWDLTKRRGQAYFNLLA